MLKFLRTNIFILVILLIAFILRMLYIEKNSLYGDELTIALDAYSLFKTGYDQLGNFLPLTFPMGAGRPAGYVYASIPFVALFGPTALGVRALSILSGLGILILLYLIGKKLFGETVGLAVAVISAVSPWEISLSRGGFEAHFALFLALLGTYFLIAKGKPILYVFSALSFGLTLHTYPTYKVNLLLFLPLLFWYQGNLKEIIHRKYFLIGVIVFFTLGVLALSQTFIGGSETRFSDINVFSQGKLKDSIEQKINFERQITKAPQPLSKYFHNKPAEYAKVLIENYLQNFSMDFLVLHGDRNPRHNMATMGEIYGVEIFLITIGLLAYWQKEKRIILFLLLWLILAPIPTATIDLPHALRSSFMLPPLIIFGALGLVTLVSQKKRVLLWLVFLVFVIQFVFLIQKLYFLSPDEYSNFWSYPAKLASEMATANKDKYNYIILSDKIDNIEFAYPVYGKIDPRVVINQNKERSLLMSYPMKKFDNIFIGYPGEDIQKFINSVPGSVLYLGSSFEISNLKDSETINGADNTTALVIKKKM